MGRIPKRYQTPTEAPLLGWLVWAALAAVLAWHWITGTSLDATDTGRDTDCGGVAAIHGSASDC